MRPKIYAFGSNGSGQLGIGHKEDVSQPTECIFLRDLKDEVPITLDCPVSRILTGGNHTLIKLANGKVYAAGQNEDGRCVLNPQNLTSMTKFHQVYIEEFNGANRNIYDSFKHVSASWEATFLVTGSPQGDRVFACGSASWGELGLGGMKCSIKPLEIPSFPPPLTKIVSIASGMGHTVAVLSNGLAYGWGASRKGQLGSELVVLKNVLSPKEIERVPFWVMDVACGREFTVLMGDKARGEFMILGAAGDKWKIISDAPKPTSIPGFLKLEASWHGIYVHQRDKSLRAWGRNDRGQLPPFDLDQEVIDFAAGSEHVVVLREDGSVGAFGWGEHGNCGPVTDAQGNMKGTFSILHLDGSLNILRVGAGCATSWLITY